MPFAGKISLKPQTWGAGFGILGTDKENEWKI